MRKIVLAVGQFNSAIGKTPANLSAVARLCAAAGERGAQLVLFPEGCLTGERAGCRACLENARDVARRLKAVYCVANPVGFDGERGYPGNSFIIGPDGEVAAVMEGTAVVEKMHEGVAVGKV